MFKKQPIETPAKEPEPLTLPEGYTFQFAYHSLREELDGNHESSLVFTFDYDIYYHGKHVYGGRGCIYDANNKPKAQMFFFARKNITYLENKRKKEEAFPYNEKGALYTVPNKMEA